MLEANDVIVSAVTMTTNITSDVFSMKRKKTAGIQAVWTGTPTGTLKLQYSSDKGTSEKGDGVTNWTDVTGSSQATGGAAGSHIWDVQTGARWLRVVYTFSSSTGTLTVTANAKGVE